MAQVTTINVAAIMDALPELVDELRAQLPENRHENLNLAYSWLLEQDRVSFTAEHVLIPSDTASSVTYAVGRTCGCGDATYRGNPNCKHRQRAWLFSQALRRAYAAGIQVAA